MMTSHGDLITHVLAETQVKVLLQCFLKYSEIIIIVRFVDFARFEKRLDVIPSLRAIAWRLSTTLTSSSSSSLPPSSSSLPCALMLSPMLLQRGVRGTKFNFL